MLAFLHPSTVLGIGPTLRRTGILCQILPLKSINNVLIVLHNGSVQMNLAVDYIIYNAEMSGN